MLYVISAILASMVVAEQYFSWESCTARETLPGSKSLPLTVKCRLILVKTLGSTSARSAVKATSHPLTACLARWRIKTTSNADHPPVPASSNSMGLAAPFLPPASGGQSICSWWPLPVSAVKAMVPAPCQVTLHSILVNPYFKNS